VANTLNLFRNGAVGFIDWLDGWCARIRRLCCGIIFPRAGFGVNKGRDVRGPFDKPQRKDEMPKDLRHI